MQSSTSFEAREQTSDAELRMRLAGPGGIANMPFWREEGLKLHFQLAARPTRPVY
jgi:hypothetical protein